MFRIARTFLPAAAHAACHSFPVAKTPVVSVASRVLSTSSTRPKLSFVAKAGLVTLGATLPLAGVAGVHFVKELRKLREYVARCCVKDSRSPKKYIRSVMDDIIETLEKEVGLLSSGEKRRLWNKIGKKYTAEIHELLVQETAKRIITDSRLDISLLQEVLSDYKSRGGQGFASAKARPIIEENHRKYKEEIVEVLSARALEISKTISLEVVTTLRDICEEQGKEERALLLTEVIRANQEEEDPFLLVS